MVIAIKRTIKICYTPVYWMLFLLIWSSQTARAIDKYSQREARPCQYCHVSPNPGITNPMTKALETTVCNERGYWYAAHDHSFVGYVEKRVVPKNSPPIFHFAWKETLMDLPRRIAVADVTGDGVKRFVSLNEKPDGKAGSILTIKKWVGKTFVTEFSTEVSGPADKLEVGRYAGPKAPAVILTSDAVWYWNGKTFVQRTSTKPLALFGHTRLRDGTERVLITTSADQVKAYRIDLHMPAGSWLVDGIEAPTSHQIAWGDMHATQEVFDRMQMPAVLGQGGLIGLWDVRDSKLFLYYAKQDQDKDIVQDPNNPGKTQIVPKGTNWCLSFFDPSPDRTRPLSSGLYFTQTLAGAIYDVAIQSPKADGEAGLLILSSDSKSGKGRSLYFFPLD